MKAREWKLQPKYTKRGEPDLEMVELCSHPGELGGTYWTMPRRMAEEHARNSRLAVLVEKMSNDAHDELVRWTMRTLLDQAAKEPK